MMIRTLLVAAGLAGAVSLPSPVLAQEPTVLLLEKVSKDSRRDLPATGMLMDQVRDTYGEPGQVQGPVGEPPITTWRYSEFSVYFEHDHVINSVRHFRRSDADG